MSVPSGSSMPPRRSLGSSIQHFSSESVGTPEKKAQAIFGRILFVWYCYSWTRQQGAPEVFFKAEWG